MCAAVTALFVVLFTLSEAFQMQFALPSEGLCRIIGTCRINFRRFLPFRAPSLAPPITSPPKDNAAMLPADSATIAVLPAFAADFS